MKDKITKLSRSAVILYILSKILKIFCIRTYLFQVYTIKFKNYGHSGWFFNFMKFKENTIRFAQKNIYHLQDILDVIHKAIIHSAQDFVNIFFLTKQEYMRNKT